jgi:hypothetical protein
MEVLVKGATSSQSDIDSGLIPQVAIEDALVNALFLLHLLPRNWVELLQDGYIIWSSIMKVDGQKRNAIRRKLVLQPSESWDFRTQGIA